MEKYYLGKLEGVDLKTQIKFVEIHYTRQAPSLGVVYLNTSTSGFNQISKLNLVVLELDDSKEVRLSYLRQLELPVRETSDLDVNRDLLLDKPQDQSHCLILADGGSTLYSVQLNDRKDESIKQLLEARMLYNSSTGPFIKCRIHHSLESTECYAHLLTEKSYTLCSASHTEASLKPLHKYLIPNNEPSHLRFVNLQTLTSDNQDITLIELNNSSFSIIHKGTCISNLNPLKELSTDYHPSLKSCQHLVLSSTSSEECLLISSCQTKIIAHSFLMNSNAKVNNTNYHDPDQLLPQDPSFELEKCWTLDLSDLESIRAISDPENHDAQIDQSCLCSMWQGHQYKQDDSWAKYLIVFYRFHVLIYSFQQQQPDLPFSFIYDKAFLGLGESEKENTNRTKDQSIDMQEYIDVKVRPKLIYNFKLIGAQPSDALFNTLLLASRNQRLVLGRHFTQLGLLAALSESGQLYAFKFTSEQLVGHRDSVYQQLLGDSIRRSSRLLLDQIEDLQKSNKQLREDISNLDSRSSEQQIDTIDTLIHINLKQRKEIGYLYDIDISISNLIKVQRLIVLSTVNSCFSTPAANPCTKSVSIDNNAALSKEKSILLANVHDLDRTELQEVLNKSQESECSVTAYALVDLSSSFEGISLSLPIYIMDGQYGQLKIFHILSDTVIINKNDQLTFGPAKLTQQGQLKCDSLGKFHLQVIDVKPLISYQLTNFSDKLSKEVQIYLEISGAFQQDQIFAWLKECLPLTTLTGSVKSPFTHCTIDFKTGNGVLKLSSEDFFALELIKKHVLKRATDQSIVLQMFESNTFSLRNLLHLISLQYNNIKIASRFLSISSPSHKKYEDSLELLFESILSEMSTSEFPTEFQVPPFDLMKNSIHSDIELLVSANINDINLQPSNMHFQFSLRGDESEYCSVEQELTVLKDLICGFIIDALVDFDKLNGVKSSNEAMISMRSKLIKIINSAIKSASGMSNMVFADSVLNAWRKLQTSNMIS